MEMSENLELEKQLKLVKKTGSFVVGRREVSSSIKGSKLLVWSASANLPQLILDECKNLSIPAIKFAGNPVELGRACGIPFRVSVIALKSVGDADISGFTKSTDYFSGTVAAPSKEAVEAKPKKKDASKPEKTRKSKKSEPGDTKSEKKSPKKKSDSKSASKKEEDEAKPKKTSRKKKSEDGDDKE